MAKAFECAVCANICGSHREHCPVCGASRKSVFWLFDGPNTWSKSHIDVDRPIHRALSSYRDISVDVAGPRLTVVYDPILNMARELSNESND